MTNHEPPTLTDEQRSWLATEVDAIRDFYATNRDILDLYDSTMLVMANRLAWLEARETERRTRPMTHSADCWRWHVDCAVAKVKVEEIIAKCNEWITRAVDDELDYKTITEAFDASGLTLYEDDIPEALIYANSIKRAGEQWTAIVAHLDLGDTDDDVPDAVLKLLATNDDVTAERDQYERDRDATAGELAVVRRALAHAIYCLDDNRVEWEHIQSMERDDLRAKVTELKAILNPATPPTTTEGEQT